jgi:hypothetical protein
LLTPRHYLTALTLWVKGGIVRRRLGLKNMKVLS